MEEVSANKPSSSDNQRYWQHHITSWQTSSLSQAAYCEQAGIDYKRFVYWRCKFRPTSQTGKQSNKKLLPVKISTATSPSYLRIRLVNQTIIEVPMVTPASQLALIIKAVGESE